MSANESDQDSKSTPSNFFREDYIEKINKLKEFQNLIFSSILDSQLIRTKYDEIKSNLTPKEIDHQLILSFSFNYERIPILSPFLSELKIEENEFIHFDQKLLFHLLKNNISFPISILCGFEVIEEYLYEELNKQNKLNLLKEEIEKNNKLSKEEKSEIKSLYKKLAIKPIYKVNINNSKVSINIRKTSKLEEIIEKDDIELFRLISNENNFDFNETIKKENKLYDYTETSILLYCIENNAMKCFKYALINGANPSYKSNKTYISFGPIWFGNKIKTKEIWNAYGFAGAIGNIQMIKMIEDQGIPINGDLIKGSSKFHQTQIIQWILKEQKNLLIEGLKECIYSCNYELFDIINQNFDLNNFRDNNNNTPIHYAAKYNSKEIFEILIKKGVDINAINNNLKIIKILFLIKRI